MNDRIDNETVEKIDLVSICRDVLREWWVILLIALSAALAANVWVNSTWQPEYRTSTTFIVTAKGMNSNIYQNLSTTKELAERLSEILESNVLEKRVAQDLDLDTLTIDSSVELVPETNLITLSVNAGTAVESYRILQSIMENYNTVSDYVIDNVIIETIQDPIVAMAPRNPLNERSASYKAFFAAAAAVILLIAGISYIRDTVKNPGDVSSKLDTRLLGTICHEKKKNSLAVRRKKGYSSMLIQNPLRSFPYVESCRMAASRIRSYMDKKGAKVLLITSVMENEGKSTVAANLALGLSQEGSRVMLIDCDFRKPAQYKIFDVRDNDEADLGDVLTSHGSADNIIRKWKDSSLYMILNKTSSNSIETLLKSTTLKKIVEFCRQKMDYVVIDTSPLALVSDTEELAHMADASVLVVRQDTVLSKDINDAIDILNNTRGQVLGCVLNDTSVQSAGSGAHGGHGGHYGYGGYYGKRSE